MVPDSLKQGLQSSWSAMRRHPLVLITAMSAGSLTMLFLGWVLSDQQGHSHASSRRSLLELLDEVSEESGRAPENNPTGVPPIPPRSRSWSSPLARQCSGLDSKVRQRLLSLQNSQDSWRKDRPIDPTNFGERHRQDAFGRALDITPVLL